MRTSARDSSTALESVAGRGFLHSSWPWRALGYALGSLPVAGVAAMVLAVLGSPLIFAVLRFVGGAAIGEVVAFGLLGVASLTVAVPLLAIPLGAVERARLRMVDRRPIDSGHRRVGARSWLRVRYTEPATWRAVGHTWLLASVVPVLYGAFLALALFVVALVVSPLLVLGDVGPVSLGFGEVTTLPGALAYAVPSAVVLLLLPYVLAVLAGAHGAATRALLDGGTSERLRAELVEVSRSRARLVDAFEAERRRIERDLHDGAQQRLVGLTLQLGLARLDLPPGSPAAEVVARAHEEAKELMAELRTFIRGIHPQVLTDRGLPAALAELADRCPVPVTVSCDLAERWRSHAESTAYFVVSEALTNVAKHSEATEASVSVWMTDVLVVEVRDDGRGGADPGAGSGLTGLADRVAVLGGRMLLSSPAGGPTLIRVELPCPSE